jgi:hypothetical protein
VSIEIRELVIKSTIRSSSRDNEESQIRESAASRSELIEECRKMVIQLVAESRRR